MILGAVVSVPLAQAQLLSGVTANPGNTQFTVTNAGFYRVSYHVNTSSSLIMGTRLLINGGVFTPALIPVSLARGRFESEVEVFLTANSTIVLQLISGLIGSITLVNNAAGASLMIIRLD